MRPLRYSINVALDGCCDHREVIVDEDSHRHTAENLALADGSYPQLLRSLARFQLLILDDWLRDLLSRSQAQDLLEVINDRYGYFATLVATQAPEHGMNASLILRFSDTLLDRPNQMPTASIFSEIPCEKPILP